MALVVQLHPQVGRDSRRRVDFRLHRAVHPTVEADFDLDDGHDVGRAEPRCPHVEGRLSCNRHVRNDFVLTDMQPDPEFGLKSGLGKHPPGDDVADTARNDLMPG